jgi:hypothetical protein
MKANRYFDIGITMFENAMIPSRALGEISTVQPPPSTSNRHVPSLVPEG